MKDRYFFRSLRKTTTQFLDMFNDIHVAKFRPDMTIDKVIKVPLKYTPKEKFIYWLYKQKLFEKRLPMIGVSMNGLSYDSARKTDKNLPITYVVGENTYQTYVNPSPWNVSYKMSLAALTMNEMDQMLEQILPFFDPYANIRVKLPEFGTTFNSKVIIDSVASTSTPEIQQDSNRITNWEIAFTVQTFIFKPIEDTGVIQKIIERFYSNDDAFEAMLSVPTSAIDSRPVSANHDFDTETVYIAGEEINGINTITEYEIFEGN